VIYVVRNSVLRTTQSTVALYVNLSLPLDSLPLTVTLSCIALYVTVIYVPLNTGDFFLWIDV
jgi:hypothetical protein